MPGMLQQPEDPNDAYLRRVVFGGPLRRFIIVEVLVFLLVGQFGGIIAAFGAVTVVFSLAGLAFLFWPYKGRHIPDARHDRPK